MLAGLKAQDFQLALDLDELEYPVANPLEMQRAWYYRMVHSRRQLVEKRKRTSRRPHGHLRDGL